MSKAKENRKKIVAVPEAVPATTWPADFAPPRTALIMAGCCAALGVMVFAAALFGALAPVKVKKAQTVWLTTKKVSGNDSVIPFDYTGPLASIKNGSHIYIDDGNIALMVEGREKDSLKTKVIVPGVIKERKGINMPDVRLDFKGLTAKDASHIRFCMENKIDFIAQSFVRSKDDILALRREMACYAHKCRVIAKIENREGINNIDSIINVCDGIMVARGDMGISIPIYEVPMVQKKIIKKCNTAKKFVITATQMLESMTENRIPTRAEVSDVANAILDGSDYVMLSAESAVGLYPVECVDMMNKIINFTSNPCNYTKV